MKRIIIIVLALVAIAGQAKAQGWLSVQAVGVLPGNTAEDVRDRLGPGSAGSHLAGR